MLHLAGRYVHDLNNAGSYLASRVRPYYSVKLDYAPVRPTPGIKSGVVNEAPTGGGGTRSSLTEHYAKRDRTYAYRQTFLALESG